MDCMEGLKLLDDNSIDLVVMDPPYLLNINKVKKTTTFNKYANDLIELCEIDNIIMDIKSIRYTN